MVLGQTLEVTGTFEWIIAAFDLLSGPVELEVSAKVSCTSSLHCFLFALEYSDKYPTGFASYVYSSAGYHLSAEAAGNTLIASHLAGGEPEDVAISHALSFGSDDGTSYVFAVLASEPAQVHLTISPAGQVREIRTGTDGVKYLYAMDFEAVADVFAMTGAGVGYFSELEEERGMIGLFKPWWGEVPTLRSAGFAGPDSSDRCLYKQTPIGGPSACPDWVLHGSPGTWQFGVSHRASWIASTDELWLLYLDEGPPELP